MSVEIVFASGNTISGADATEALQSICGGWNPNTVPELRQRLAHRAGYEVKHTEGIEQLSDEDFVRLLDIKGFWCYRVHSDTE